MPKKDFGILFYLHLVLIIFTYLTPFLFNFWLMALGVAILELQYYFLGGCVLTHAELGKSKYQTFYHYYLVKIFPNLKPKSIWIFTTFVLPGVGLLVSLLLKYFNFTPLIY